MNWATTGTSEIVLAAEEEGGATIHVGHHTMVFELFGMTFNGDTIMATGITALIVIALAFVLRAKVRLSDASQQWALWGAAGDAVPVALPPAVWSVWRDGDRTWVRLPPGAGVPRALLIQPASAPAPEGPALAPAHWQWLAVMSGVAHITDPVVEAFVPQMINYESVGGVHFKKGCYPGQEVVARSQFRGTLKRRGYLVHADGPLAAGQEVFHAADPEQPAGLVVQAAPHPVAGWDAIVSLQISAADGQPLTAGGPDGVPVRLQALPYELLQDI